MKRLYDITVQDLKDQPIWLYQGESDDVATVTPVPDFDFPYDAIYESAYIAKTRFTTASGVDFFGYCSPTDPSGLDYIQPVIIHGSRHINLWDDTANSATSQAVIANALGLECTDVFPLHYYCCEASLENEHWEETIGLVT